jgi:hypothetical protein
MKINLLEEKMVRNILLVLMIGVFLLSACSSQLTPGVSTADPVAETPVVEDTPVVGETPVGQETQDGSPESWAPVPEDENLGRAEVEIGSSEILTLESFPPQYQLQVTGSKGNPCNMLRVVVNDPDEENNILVDVYTVFDPAAICIQVLEGFDINIPLGSYPAGEYTVLLNGEQIGMIEAP